MLEMLLDSMSAVWHCHAKSQQRKAFFFFFNFLMGSL